MAGRWCAAHVVVQQDEFLKLAVPAGGSGADRQLRVFEQTGDLKKVVDYIIEETEAGLEEDPADVRKVG